MWIAARHLIAFGLVIACGCGEDAHTPDDKEGVVASVAPQAAPATSSAAAPVEAVSASSTRIAPGLLAQEFTWHTGQPPVTMIHRDDGFAFLSGFRGQLAPPTEVGAVMDAEGDWVLSGTTDQSALFGHAVAVPWFVEIEQPVEFKTWRVGSGNLTELVRQQDGFCVLLMVGGHFRGATEQFRLRVLDGSWRLNARSRTRRTHMTVMVVRVKEPGSFHGIVREHEWHTDNGQGPIRLIHSADGFAFLSGLSGSFIDDREFARVTLGDDGYWYLEGRSHDGEAHAWATSIQLTGTQTRLVATNDLTTSPTAAMSDTVPAADAVTPPSAPEATIDGEWEILEATDHGHADDDLVGDVYVFSEDGRELAIHFDGSRSAVNTFRLDCRIDPPRKHVEYDLAGNSFLGIYSIEGDRLTLCFDMNERPADFTSTADNENRLLVLKRVGAPDPEPAEMPRPEVAATAMTPAEARAALEETGFEFTDEDGLKAVFAGDQLTDDDLAPFQHLPEITGIALIETPVTDAGLEYLTGLENLKDLDLEYARITDDGVRRIGQMTRLEGLGIRFCENVTGDALQHLTPLTHLKFLFVDGVDIGPGQLQFAREMGELEMFGFHSSGGLAESDLRILGGMTKLTGLDLHAEPWVNDNTISHLSNLKALEELDLSWTDISDSAMQTVAGLPRLQGLSLLETGVGDDGMEHLSQLTELHAIDLSCTEVTSRGLAALRECPLTDLTLRGPSVTDRHLAPLRQWKELTALNLQGDYYYAPDEDQPTFVPTQITLRGIQTLSELDQLQMLWLTINPQITDAAVPYLSKLKNLQVLDLTGTGITSQGGRAIAEAIDGLELEDLGIEEE